MRSAFAPRDLEALENDIDQLMWGYDFIVEGDLVRTLPRSEALKFWTQWWSDEGNRR